MFIISGAVKHTDNQHLTEHTLLFTIYRRSFCLQVAVAGLDLQVFEGPAHLDPEVKRGPALKKNISLYPVTLISPWKWGADLNSQGPSSTSATKLSVRLRDHEIVWSQLSVEFNHWWRQNKSCQREGWVFKIKYIENTGKLNNSFILLFFVPG